MKSNIDLTINRDFNVSQKQIVIQQYNEAVNIALRQYDEIYFDNDDINWSRPTEALLTGNKSIRDIKKYTNEAVDQRRCDRCGCVIKYPWESDGCLCKKCDVEFHNEIQSEQKGKSARTYILYPDN